MNIYEKQIKINIIEVYLCVCCRKELQRLYLFIVFISISVEQYQWNIRPQLMEAAGKVSKILIHRLYQTWRGIENCCLLKG